MVPCRREAEQNVRGQRMRCVRGATPPFARRESTSSRSPATRLPLRGVDVTVVSSARGRFAQGARGRRRAKRRAADRRRRPAEDADREPALDRYSCCEHGRFRFSRRRRSVRARHSFALACPNDKIGPVDVVSRRSPRRTPTAADARDLLPRSVRASSLLNNGATKGGAAETFAKLLRQSTGSRRRLAAAPVDAAGRRQLRGRADREPRRDDRALDQSCSECRWIVRGNERADGRVARLRGALMPP